MSLGTSVCILASSHPLLGTICDTIRTRGKEGHVAMKRMDIETVVVGGGPVTSLVVLKTRHPRDGEASEQLPIRIGPVEATAISMGVDDSTHDRPMTHDLMLDTIGRLGSSLDAVQIVDVRGTTFYAKLLLTNANGARVEVDARPSDALALAVRAHVPIFADEGVIESASMPNFDAVKRDEENRELERFRDFLKDVSPDDFKEQQRK